MKTKIALCQVNPSFNEPEINFHKMEAIIDKYSKKNVKLFILPEDYLYGVLRDRNQITIAGKKFDFWVKRISSLAKKYQVDLIPGSFPLLEKNKLLNTTIYIDKNGQVLNQYSKTNLWLSERAEFTPNTQQSKSFNSVLGKTVQIICWDLMNPKIFEEA